MFNISYSTVYCKHDSCFRLSLTDSWSWSALWMESCLLWMHWTMAGFIGRCPLIHVLCCRQASATLRCVLFKLVLPFLFYLNIIIINMIFVCLSIKGLRTIKKICAFKHWSIDYICITPWKNSPVIKCSVFLFY